MTATPGDQPRGPHAETLARVPVVAKWLVDGISRLEILDRARDRWGIAPRTTDRLIAAARVELKAGWDSQRDEMIALLLTRSDIVYAMAIEQKNAAAAIGAINTVMRLARL